MTIVVESLVGIAIAAGAIETLRCCIRSCRSSARRRKKKKKTEPCHHHNGEDAGPESPATPLPLASGDAIFDDGPTLPPTTTTPTAGSTPPEPPPEATTAVREGVGVILGEICPEVVLAASDPQAEVAPSPTTSTSTSTTTTASSGITPPQPPASVLPLPELIQAGNEFKNEVVMGHEAAGVVSAPLPAESEPGMDQEHAALQQPPPTPSMTSSSPLSYHPTTTATTSLARKESEAVVAPIVQDIIRDVCCKARGVRAAGAVSMASAPVEARPEDHFLMSLLRPMTPAPLPQRRRHGAATLITQEGEVKQEDKEQGQEAQAVARQEAQKVERAMPEPPAVPMTATASLKVDKRVGGYLEAPSCQGPLAKMLGPCKLVKRAFTKNDLTLTITGPSEEEVQKAMGKLADHKVLCMNVSSSRYDEINKSARAIMDETKTSIRMKAKDNCTYLATIVGYGDGPKKAQDSVMEILHAPKPTRGPSSGSKGPGTGRGGKSKRIR